MVLLSSYINSFRGLRREVWWLALVTFINRAGTMVIPFLSLYLTGDRGFSLPEVGWVMTAFGCGSLLGSWLGGKLTDRIGHRPIMTWSLLISGMLFVLFQYIESYWGICLGVFVLMSIADTFRPAMFVSLSAYSKPENRARSISLIRLAINLGFSMGPAAGGLIIATGGYSGLFWIDGITCMLAALVFVFALKPKEVVGGADKSDEEVKPARSPYSDGPFLMFIAAVVLIAFSFLQLFSTLPLYYRDVHGLGEDEIGYLMAFNGLFIFIFEMPLIKYFEKPRFSLLNLLIVSTLILAMSFFVLNTSAWVGVIVIGMFFITIGEMLNFPFGNSFAMGRAQQGRAGSYMALYTMGFGVSHIFSHNTGMQLINRFGYDATWYVMGGLLLVATGILLVLKKMVEKEKSPR